MALVSDVEYRCYISGFSGATNVSSLKETFKGYGEILDCKIISGGKINSSGGLSYVIFSSEDAMIEACKGMNGKELNGQTIYANPVIFPRSRVDNGGIYGGGGNGGGHIECDGYDRDVGSCGGDGVSYRGGRLGGNYSKGVDVSEGGYVGARGGNYSEGGDASGRGYDGGRGGNYSKGGDASGGRYGDSRGGGFRGNYSIGGDTSGSSYDHGRRSRGYPGRNYCNGDDEDS